MKRIISFFTALVMLFATMAFSPVAEAAFSGDDKVVIVIDPGHGGNDGTGTAIGNYAEKTATLELSLYLKQYLEENGNFKVYITRSTDTSMTLAQRAYYANNVNADLLFSVHFNGSTSASANGVSAWTSVFSQYAVDALSYKVLSNLSALGFSSEGVMHKQDTEGYYWNTEKQWDIQDPSLGILSDYYGIPTYSCKFGIQSVIIEHGYFSNSHDASLILSEGMFQKMARADADAIISYYTNHTHTYGGVTRDFPSNCTLTGKQSNHCTICYHRKNVTDLPADPDNHYYYVSSSSGQATCTEDAQVTYVCRIAENLNEKGIPCAQHILNDVTEKATGHNYVVTYHTDVGHITDGVTVTTCTKCNDSYTETEYAPGHSWEQTGHLDPECTVDGGDSYRCSVCGEERFDVISAPGHSFVRNALLEEPTCTEGGSEDVTCSVCGYNCVLPLDALGHDFYRTSLIKEADCTNAGREAVTCARCGLETELDIPALEHYQYFLEHLDSTCSVQGYDKYYCQRCDSEYYVYIEQPAHELTPVSEADATCTEDGYIEYSCTVCGETERVITETASHKYEESEVVDATCEADGKIVSVCTVCGEQDVYILEATGHNWNSGEEVRATGFFVNGKVCYTCLNDPTHIEYESIPSTFSANGSARFQFISLVCSLLVSAAAASGMLYIRKKKDSDKAPVKGESMVAAATAIAEKAIKKLTQIKVKR